MLPRTNRLLAAFGDDLELIRPKLRTVMLHAGQVLCEPGERIRTAYFLQHGIVSKLTVFEDGTEIETALVGCEGAIGVFPVLGVHKALTRDVCHLRAQALSIDAPALMLAAQISERIHSVIDNYVVWVMSCAIRNGACNARHAVEPRLCRWLLTCSDVLSAAEIPLSQDVFAKMLGVQRSSVNPILQRLRVEGLIDLGRSRLVLVNRQGLLARACECYQAMRWAEDEILTRAVSPAGSSGRSATAANWPA